MKKLLVAVAAVAGLALTVAVFQPRTSRAADADDDQNIVGVMRVDMAPIVSQIQALRQEVAAMRQSVEILQKALADSQAQQADMVQAIKNLSPMGWDYKLLRIINEKESQLLGLQGWQMVAVTPQGWVFFRRPLQIVPEDLRELR